MKRFCTWLVGLGIVAAMWAPLYVYGGSAVTMSGPMTDSNAALGQAYTKSFTLDTDNQQIDVMAVQTTYSSATFSATKTFNDGLVSTATLTVASYADLSTQTAHGTLTVLSTSSLGGVVASTSILVSSNATGTRLTITGPPANVPNVIVIGGNVAAGFSSTNTAANIGTFWSATTSNNLFRSSVSGSSVTFAFISSGTFANAYAITSSSQAAISSATFVGGVNPATITVAGSMMRAGYEWSVGADTNTTALNIAAAINVYVGTNSGVNFPIIATNTFNVVYATANATGSVGNNQTLTSGISSITVSAGGTFLGGTDNASFTIGVTSLVANKDFYPITSNAVTASAIVTAWGLSASSLTVTLATTGNVIGATTTAVGTTSQYATRTSTQSALTLSPYTSSSTTNGAAIATGNMYGGLNSSFTINTSTIKLASHGLPVGLQVWFSTAANVGISPLLVGTTYYIISVDANNIQLALTSTGAVAGTPVVFTSSRTPTTTDTFTLNIATTTSTQTGSFAFWASNDGSLYTQVGSTNTATFVYPSTATFTDIGAFDYKYFQARVVAPTAGAMPITINVHGEKR